MQQMLNIFFYTHQKWWVANQADDAVDETQFVNGRGAAIVLPLNQQAINPEVDSSADDQCCE